MSLVGGKDRDSRGGVLLCGTGPLGAGVGWNLGTGYGISSGQAEEHPFHAAGRAAQMCKACRWGGRKVRASFPDRLYFSL